MRYLFCINAGRSGSNYLAEILATAQGVAAFHEAEPTMHGEPLHQVNSAPLSSSYAERRVKVDGIVRLLAERPWAITYAETNHMFIKTFFDVVVNELHGVEVIYLRRDPAHVLKSFVELGYFSSLNPVWPDWMSSPNAVTAAHRALDQDHALDQYDRCIAYLYDIHARAARFRRDYPHIVVHEVRLEDIVELEGALALFDRLRVTPTTRTAEVAGRVVNDRPHVKERISNPADLAECRRRLDEYSARAGAQSTGAQVPLDARGVPSDLP